MRRPRLFGRTVSLREAASVVFALVAIVPILLFVYLLSRANLLRQTEAQLALFVALVVSVLGFLVFRRIVDQIARLARGLRAPGAGAIGAPDRPGPVGQVPGLGRVAEIGQVTDAFHGMLEDLRGATQRLEDLVFKLGTLNEMVELAARIPRIQDLLVLVLQTTMRAVRAASGSIMILDRDRETLRLAASRGMPDTILGAAEVRVGEGIAGRVAQQGEPLLIEAMETDPRFDPPDGGPRPGGAFICMPIRAGERVLGVINMVRTREGTWPLRAQPFSPTDLQFLNALMTYVGYVVDNARLLEEAQQSARQLQKLVDDLRATQEQLVRGETLRAMGQLSSGMTHHLNNLFAVILGRTELLLGEAQDAGVRRSLEIIHRTAEDGAEVARRVQRFSRLQPITELAAVDLNEVAREVIEATRSRWEAEARERGLHIEVALEAGGIPPVAGEPVALREALMNVVLNAIEAMPEGGMVTIRTWAGDGHAHCAVADPGVGMSRDARRRAIEPFFTTKGPQATGLGLSVAYGAVKRYGGALGIESAEGRGTTVTITLPVAGRALAAETASAAAPAAVGPLRILLIDDEPVVRESLADLLEAQGHTVLKAGTGAEGLGFLDSGVPIDVVLTDLGMPDMTGWEVARAVRDRRAGLPVGVITGWDEQALDPQQRRLADFVIAKPFDHAVLREALAGVRL